MPWNTQTAFLEACRAGDIDSVNAMIAQNYHPDVRSVTILRLQSFLKIKGNSHFYLFFSILSEFTS